MPVHPSAIVDPLARIDATAIIGPHVVIEGPVTIGPDCRIESAATLVGHTTIGGGTHIHPHAVIGEVPQDKKFHGETSFCEIGAGCEIREGVTVHRATVPGAVTRVGDRCRLMTNSHVAHDCIVEEEVSLGSSALLGGHAWVGRGAFISGHAGIHQFVRVGELTLITSLTMVGQDIPPFTMTDHQGRVVGLNATGLQEAGIDPAAMQELKLLFHTFYRSGQSLPDALETARTIASSKEGTRFLEFIEGCSTRGFRKSFETQGSNP
jgi:UDP-N-acetylglucosamine acyltransferase